MTTSNSYSFSPSLGELTIYAFNLAGVRATALTQEHMNSARMAANLVLAEWSGMPGANLWTVELITANFVAGTATYTVPTNVIAILDLFVSVTTGSVTTNRYIMPISRTEYASYANPTQQGFPTTYWFDRLLNGNLTFWPVPDGNEASFSYYAMRQIQDAAFSNGQTIEAPVYFMRAFAYALAHELANMWNPQIAPRLEQLAEKSYSRAVDQNVETAAIYFSPTLSSYWRT